MVYKLEEINARINKCKSDFVRECESSYKEKLESTADAIVENLSVTPVVLLSGPSGSGKTTTSLKLCELLASRGIIARTVSFDNYFKPIDDSYPRTESGDLDFESPDCLDFELLNEHYMCLKNRQPIQVPRYDFTTGKRSKTKFDEVSIGRNEVIIFEGIHALNDRIAGVHPEAFCIFVDVLAEIDCGENGVFENDWVRLMRRVIRDKKFRGADAEYTLFLWQNVIEGEKKNITPFRDKAKVEIDTFIPYEINVLKSYIVPLFERIPDSSILDEERREILKLLGYAQEIHSRNVPKDSLIREFIGGGIYSY